MVGEKKKRERVGVSGKINVALIAWCHAPPAASAENSSREKERREAVFTSASPSQRVFPAADFGFFVERRVRHKRNESGKAGGREKGRKEDRRLHRCHNNREILL